jgi:hypothetical protein
MEALKDIPEIEAPLMTLKGDAVLQKTDIFRKIMWFGYKEETTWYPLNIVRVNEILEWNRSGRKPANLEENQEAEKAAAGPLNSDLQDLDKKFRDKSKKKKKHTERHRRDNGPKGDTPGNEPGNNKPGNNNPGSNNPGNRNPGNNPRNNQGNKGPGNRGNNPNNNNRGRPNNPNNPNNPPRG